jgi:aspartate aminotransferase
MVDKSYEPAHSYTVNPAPESPTLKTGAEIGAAFANLKAETGRDGVNLGVGVPFGAPPEAVEELAQRLIREMETFPYLPLTGGKDMERLAKEFMEGRLHFPSELWRDGQKVSFGAMPLNGAKDCLSRVYNALAIKTWLVPVPFWPTNQTLIERSGAKLIPIRCHRDNGYRMTDKQLEEAASQYPGSGLVLTNPSNPLSVSYRREHLEKLAPVILKHVAFVVEDGIYNRLNKGERIPLLPEVEPRITGYAYVGGGAKDLCYAGNRPGLLYAPTDVIANVKGWKSEDSGNQPAYALAVMRACLDDSPEIQAAIQKHIKDRVELYGENREIIRTGLQQIGFSFPQDANEGLYVWCATPEGRNLSEMITPQGDRLNDTEGLNNYMMKNGVAGIPGHLFYPRGYEDSSAGRDEMRLSLGLTSQEVQRGIDTMVELVKGCRLEGQDITYGDFCEFSGFGSRNSGVSM